MDGYGDCELDACATVLGAFSSAISGDAHQSQTLGCGAMVRAGVLKVRIALFLALVAVGKVARYMVVGWAF